MGIIIISKKCHNNNNIHFQNLKYNNKNLQSFITIATYAANLSTLNTAFVMAVNGVAAGSGLLVKLDGLLFSSSTNWAIWSC